VIEASTAVVEIELPAGARASELRMAIPLVSHLVTSAKADFLMPKAAAACNVDAMCQQATWGTQMNAVARMIFSSGGSSYLCTGTLLADTDPSTTVNYFLSANHCINSQTVASSLVNYWFWRSTACDSGMRGPYVQQAGGAALLYNSTATDVSFMRLNTAPPGGVTYAGWQAGSPVATSGSVTGLHHPTGDLLKISSGAVLGYLTCTPPTSGQFSCSNVGVASATFYDVGWNSGVVEGGSSGSALFDGGKYVVGQLYGGSSSCTNVFGSDSYGRFDVSYRAALSQWLNPPVVTPPPPPPPQTLTVTKSGTGAGTVTSAPSGINCGSACSASFPQGTSVTLTATSANLSKFAGWSGGGCSGVGTCTVEMLGAMGVTAAFTATGNVTMSASSLTFGAVQGTQTVTFTNNTGGAVTFLQASVSSARFGQSNNCGVVAVGGSCSAAVTYFPGAIGSDTGTLTLTSTAPNSPHVVSLQAVQSTASAVTRLTNISARGQVLTGSDVMIGGFVIGGTSNKTVVVRARGPSLVPYGIANALSNPTLQLVRASDQAIIASNDDWVNAPNASTIQASGFAPSNGLESALLVSLGPGAYTAIVSGVGNATGVGMVEVFEVDHPEVPLANISTRGQVRTGDDVLIGGFIVAGSSPQTVVVRARGPSLSAYGIANPLANPTLRLVRSSDQATLATNDDWGAAPNATSLATSGFAPSNAQESAILVTLNPGAYTAIVSGVGGGTGVGIVEVFAQ
jgi:hypothetical protein